MTQATHTVRLERVIQAPQERVYDAWTDPKHIAAWFGPQGMTIPEIEFSSAIGVTYRCVMRSPEGNDHVVSGVIKTLDRPNRLVMTWGWKRDGVRGQESTVDVRFEAQGDTTLMKFEHRDLENDESAQQHTQGWTSSFEKLGPHLSA